MRLVVLVFAFMGLMLADEIKDIKTIDNKLKNNSQKLKNLKDENKKISNKLESLGIKINVKRKTLQEMQNKKTEIEKSVKLSEEKTLSEIKLLKDLEGELLTLNQSKVDLKNKIINLIINDIGFVFILSAKSMQSKDDIVLEEIFTLLKQKTKQNLALLSKQQLEINKSITQKQDTIATLQTSIQRQKNRELELQTIANNEKNLLDSMNEELQEYNQKLKQNDDERRSLDRILQNLNILRKEKIDEIEKERQRLAAERERQKLKSSSKSINVRQVASSFRNVETQKYTGNKTIAPLENYTITQKYGPHFDPVYKMRVFNEGVILTSKTPNAIVKNILDGKVVYAKDTAVLKKVIIIEHSDQMHTIYAQIDKIAPTIKAGVRIKKGYVIGRVNKNLSFEVTKKDKHINPMDLIVNKKIKN